MGGIAVTDSGEQPDPAAVAARILAETGIDVSDPAAAEAAAAIGAGRARRQVLGTIGGSLLLVVALLCLVLTFAPATKGASDPGVGVRVAFAVVGVALGAAGVWLLLRAWRPSKAYREVFLPRQAAVHRYLAEIGQPWNPLGHADRLTRAALIAYSTPTEVREMKAAERAAEEREKENDA